MNDDKSKVSLTLQVDHAELRRDEQNNLVATLVGINELELRQALDRYRAAETQLEADRQAAQAAPAASPQSPSSEN